MNKSELLNAELLAQYDSQLAIRNTFRSRVFDLIDERDAALVDADLDSVYEIKVQTSKRLQFLMDEFENAVHEILRHRNELEKRGINT